MTSLAALLAILVGLSLGLLGGGGSILTLPIFRYALGMEVKQAIGMSLGVVSLTSLAGALRHWRQGNLELRALVAFAPAAIVSTFVGAKVARFVPGSVQMIGFAMVMAVAALLMWGGKTGVRPPVTEGGVQRRPEAIIGIGLGLGFLTGVIGVGGGFLIVPALVLLLGLEMKRAVGTSLAVISLNAASGFAGYLGQVAIDWALMAGFAAIAIVGVFIGSALVTKVSQEQLRRGFAVFLIVVAAYIIIQR